MRMKIVSKGIPNTCMLGYSLISNLTILIKWRGKLTSTNKISIIISPCPFYDMKRKVTPKISFIRNQYSINKQVADMVVRVIKF